MSVDQWGVELYGVNVANLKFKDEENGYDNLCELLEDEYDFDVYVEVNSKGVPLEWVPIRDDDYYFGYAPKYPWFRMERDENNLTKEEVADAIAQFLDEYIVDAKKQVTQNIEYFNLVNWG